MNDSEKQALLAEIERLKRFHAEDMRVTNASADFHIKLCEKQRQEIKAMGKLLDATNHTYCPLPPLFKTDFHSPNCPRCAWERLKQQLLYL